MTVDGARRLVSVFFLCCAVATTWPALLIINRPQVRVLGLPLPFFWVILWIVLGFLVLLLLEWAVLREEGETVNSDRAPGG